MSPPDVAIVTGTYNRRKSLEACVESVRRSVGQLSCVFMVADGGSTDGSREWLLRQPDCELLEGGLEGSVAAFNTGFAKAVEIGARAVGVENDDTRFIGPKHEIEESFRLLQEHRDIGSVGWNSDRYGEWRFEKFQGIVYGTQCLVRREAGMSVARAQGDPTGKKWWDPRLFGYGADTCFGLWLKRLGWQIHEAHDLRVHDSYQEDGGHKDPLRSFNDQHATQVVTDVLFGTFGNPVDCSYRRADAERFGGFLQ